MAKNVYIGVSGKARKTKNIYIGIGGKARRVLKGYIGVGGKARLFYVKEWRLEKSTATSLNTARDHIAATTVGNYALFAGGYTNNSNSSIVDTYNSSLTHSTATNLSSARGLIGATTVGNYALFAGGGNKSNSYTHSTVDAYNTSLTRSTPTTLPSTNMDLAATTVGNYALFAAFSAVYVYDSSLTYSTATGLIESRNSKHATTVGNYALFAGGVLNSNYKKKVDVYDTSLTHSTATDLNTARASVGATTVGNYALFAGGYDAVNVIYAYSRDDVDVYNSSLTHSTATNLSSARYSMGATTVGNYAIFAGGIYENAGTNTSSEQDIVDTYNLSLTHSTATNLSVARDDIAATTIGYHALFSGNSSTNTVDVYTLS